MSREILFEYFSKEDLLKIFPEKVLKSMSDMVNLDVNDLGNQMRDLLSHRHNINQAISTIKYKLSLEEKRLKKTEFKIWKDILINDYKVQNLNERKLIIESNDEHIKVKHQIDKLEVQLDFLERLGNLLESKHYMIKNYMDYLMWTKGDK